jgi:hypothetical protein
MCVVCCRKQLEQREKDAEEFYKSDSDDSVTNVSSTCTTRDNNDNIGITTTASTKIFNNNSFSDTNICISKIGTPESSKTSAVGISANDIGISFLESSSGVDVAISEASVSSSNANIYTQEAGAGNSVCSAETKSLSSTQVADINCEAGLGLSQMAEGGCDFQLRFSESHCEDVREPLLVTHSALHDEVSSALDICLEATNTEDLVLHYTESSLPGAEEEPQKQEKTVSQEDLQLPSPNDEGDDNRAKTVLQSLARRSLPGLGDITTLKPHLSGADSGVIELDDEEPGPAGVVKLVARFMKHSSAKRPPEKKHSVEVGYVHQLQILLQP